MLFKKNKICKLENRKIKYFCFCKDGSLFLIAILASLCYLEKAQLWTRWILQTFWDPCTTIRHKTNQINVSGMIVAAILQPNSFLLSQLCCQRSPISDHREGQLQGSMTWQTKRWTKKKRLNSAWHWFLPHTAWNHKSKSVETQAVTVITHYFQTDLNTCSQGTPVLQHLL